MTDHTPEPVVLVTEYTVSCLPEGHQERSDFEITVAYRSPGKWAVSRWSRCLDAKGRWDYESIPSEREDEWLARHRCDLETALRLARAEAPKVTVNGYTVADALKMGAGR